MNVTAADSAAWQPTVGVAGRFGRFEGVCGDL